jgi:2-oxoglutarate ferredoxin oxidoreductase subunit beta
MPELAVLSADDLAAPKEVRWCPGCGDFSILAQFRQALASLRLPREKIVLVSGVGCAARLPFYVTTYGFQSIHGHGPAIATGLKIAQPDLQVWVITGDGDALFAGAHHLIHAMRRNVDIKILLFNNEVMGVVKGHSSPTARPGTRTKSSPEGSFETPLRPLSLALASECTFVARTIDVEINHLTETLRRAAMHRGTAFVEILQNCKTFNDGVFEYATDHTSKADDTIFLEHRKPLLFGKDRHLGLRLRGLEPEVVKLGPENHADSLLVHEEDALEPTAAFLLSRMAVPVYPECFGVFRSVSEPTFEDQFFAQIRDAGKARKPQKLDDFLAGDEAWSVA